jgi:tRNA G18 (ribose-2'-O)-methylase SpoU
MTGPRSKQRARATMLARYERHRRANLLAEPGVHELVIVLDHLKAGFNVAKIFRSAQAFGAREVHLIGIGPFDPAPAKGALKAVPARFFDDFESAFRVLAEQDYRVFRFAADAGTALPQAVLPAKSAFVFGHEAFGCSFLPGGFPDIDTLRIPQYGRVESLNVSIAAGIAMYEYVRRFGSAD